ncbi:MAG: hypothetical protein HZB59_03540 [Ignavibacteriales bacterium]|nr:hypothetical protein [Ignavibacteriales bacterium]
MALLIVLGLSVVVGIISFNINRSKNQLSENVTGFMKYSTSRNIAHTGVNLLLRRLDTNDSSVVNPLERNEIAKIVPSVMAGKCTVTVQVVDPVTRKLFDMTSRAFYMDTIYRMKLRLSRSPKPFPKINSAVGLCSDGFQLNFNGNPHIYGENYNMNGTRGNSALDTNGVSVISKAESLLIAGSSGYITGDPKKIIVNPPDDPGSYVPEYISSADVVFANGSNNTGNYGTPSTPIIGYVDGKAKFGGGGKFYGVLIVHGDIDFVGTFDFYGLVIAYSENTTVEVSSATGTPQIWGAVLATGPSGSSLTMKGTADIRYSVEALQMATFINKMQAYRVVSWYE